MKNPEKLIWIFSLFMVFLLGACQDDEEVVAPVEDEVEEIQDASENELLNNWIYEVMQGYYYWNDDVTRPNATSTPEDYFYSLLVPDDQFSFITDDYEGLMNEFSGVYQTMGYSPSFGLLSSSNQVFIVVEYVYPGSPAEEAGLRRGDIILEIDRQQLNTENYYDLFIQSQYTVTLGTYDGTDINLTDNTISLTSEVIQADPVLYSEVKTLEGTNVGYLVYTEFISGNNQEWLTSLTESLRNFQAANISELIIDLRYNPGGEIDAAQYLASAIAPSSAVTNEEVLVRYEYNDDLARAIRFTEGQDSENLITTFSDIGINLNLSRVIFLTAQGTASASELLINGLEPYMDVVTVGESTVGKFYGSWVIPDVEEPARHTWAVAPVVLKYANAIGDTDFSDGLFPDYPVEDNLLAAAYSFGDENDPVLQQALSLVFRETGARTVSPQKLVSPYNLLPNPLKERKSYYLDAILQ
ncbi:MAG: S41 family peptidase [Bacteroidota bacterium]